jgi:hypothetical protein
MEVYPMRDHIQAYPLFWNALLTVGTVALIIFIPELWMRIVVGLLWYAQVAWLWFASQSKKPLLMPCQQRRRMMMYHVDTGLALAQDECEREILLDWIDANMSA